MVRRIDRVAARRASGATQAIRSVDEIVILILLTMHACMRSESGEGAA